MKKKWISCLLTLVMLVTLSPAVTLTASADSLNTVVAKRANEVLGYLISGGCHIVLDQDTYLGLSKEDMKTFQTVKGKSVLDLNGHTLTFANDSLDCKNSTLFEIPSGAELTIMDSGKDGELRYNSYIGDKGTIVDRDLFDVRGKLTLDSGTLEAGRSKSKFVAGHGTAWFQTFGTAINVYSGGEAIINGGRILGRGQGRQSIYVAEGGKLLINNAEINGRGGADCLKASSDANVQIKNGTFKTNTLFLIKVNGDFQGGPPYGRSGIYSTFYDSATTTVTNNKPQYRNGSIYESQDVTVKTKSSGGMTPPDDPPEITTEYSYESATIPAKEYADIKLNIDRDIYEDENGFVPAYDGVSVDRNKLPEGMKEYASEADTPGFDGTPVKPGYYQPVFTVNLFNQSTKQRWKIIHTYSLMVTDPDVRHTVHNLDLKKDEALSETIPLNLDGITGNGYYDADLISGALPEGMNYGLGDADRPYLYGTPQQSGTFKPVFLVTLFNGVQVEVSMTINVSDTPETQNPSGIQHLLNPFVDVSESDEYYTPIIWAYYSVPQITNGMDETHFGPQLTVTRGQAVTFLWRSMGRPEPSSMYNPFTDVPSDEYYYKPVLWAVEKGITKGVDATHFNPMDTLSTQHIITFLYRTKNPGKDGWDGEAAAWAADQNGRPFGVDIEVNNITPCPRCHVVTFLYRAVENILSGNDFFMYIEDVFNVSGQGIIVTGRINSGKVKTGDTIRLLSYNTENNQPVEKICSVKAIEIFRKLFDEAMEGDNVGIHLEGIQSESELQTGDVLTGALVPMSPQTAYTGTLTLKTKEQGGRNRPIYNEYMPQIYIGAADVNSAGISGLPDAGLNPGDTAANITITLRHPAVAYVGQELTVREGGRTVGSFTVEGIR